MGSIARILVWDRRWVPWVVVRVYWIPYRNLKKMSNAGDRLSQERSVYLVSHAPPSHVLSRLILLYRNQSTDPSSYYDGSTESSVPRCCTVQYYTTSRWMCGTNPSVLCLVDWGTYHSVVAGGCIRPGTIYHTSVSRGRKGWPRKVPVPAARRCGCLVIGTQPSD